MTGGLYEMVPLICESSTLTLPWYSVIFDTVANHMRPFMNSVDSRIPLYKYQYNLLVTNVSKKYQQRWSEEG